MHNCHSTARCPSAAHPLPIHPHPQSRPRPLALDPRPLTQGPSRRGNPARPAQPGPHCCHLPLSRRMLPSALLRVHSAAAPLMPFLLRRLGQPPLDPDARRQPPRAATTLGLVFISTRTGNDSLQQLPWLGPAPRLVASSTVGPNSLALARGRVPSTETISNPAQRDAAARQVCHLMFFFFVPTQHWDLTRANRNCTRACFVCNVSSTHTDAKLRVCSAGLCCCPVALLPCCRARSRSTFPAVPPSRSAEGPTAVAILASTYRRGGSTCDSVVAMANSRSRVDQSHQTLITPAPKQPLPRPHHLCRSVRSRVSRSSGMPMRKSRCRLPGRISRPQPGTACCCAFPLAQRAPKRTHPQLQPAAELLKTATSVECDAVSRQNHISAFSVASSRAAFRPEPSSGAVSQGGINHTHAP